ncbi:MAG TPA: diguanylate cyclase [Anaerolineales bacterium]
MTHAIIPKPLKVLLVENNQAESSSTLRAMLDKLNLRLKAQQATHLNKALRLLAQEDFDLVLLDLYLPDSHGLDTFLQIYEQTPQVPVVVVGDEEQQPLALEVIREGAQDYLVRRAVEKDALEKTILYALERQRYRTMLQNLSMRDELTGLLNRRGFLSLAGQHLKIAQRSNWMIMLLFADLDELKEINDQFGHVEGDEALRSVARILRQTFRASDIIARLGGDEFIVLAVKITDEGIKIIAKRLREKVQKTNQNNPHYQISLSFGVVKFDPQAMLSLEEMIAQADKALYESKETKGKG